jgi:hypothetical protein
MKEGWDQAGGALPVNRVIERQGCGRAGSPVSLDLSITHVVLERHRRIVRREVCRAATP